jgi:hypothetical protein
MPPASLECAHVLRGDSAADELIELRTGTRVMFAGSAPRVHDR